MGGTAERPVRRELLKPTETWNERSSGRRPGSNGMPERRFWNQGDESRPLRCTIVPVGVSAVAWQESQDEAGLSTGPFSRSWCHVARARLIEERLAQWSRSCVSRIVPPH